MSVEKKQRLKEYQKIYFEAKKSQSKSLNLIINMFYGFNSVCYDLDIHY